jgi:hypothetical protein
VKRFVARPGARRSVTGVLRELWSTLRIIVSPPMDVEGFEHRGGYPMPPNPQLASESAFWRREHADQAGPEISRQTAPGDRLSASPSTVANP